MGGCAGKNKSKRSNSSESKSDANKKPKPRTKDDQVKSKSLSSLPENLSSSNSSTIENNKHISTTEQNGIDPEVQLIIDQQNGVSKALGQIFSSRVVSVTDAELEYELANLIYGHPENDYAENPLLVTTCKSTDV